MPVETRSTVWREVQCALDRGRPEGAAIGLIALAADTVIEPELRASLRVTKAEFYVTRIPFPFDVSPTSLHTLAENLPAAVKLLLPGERLDVVAFGCTSGAIAIGPATLRATINRARPGVRVTDPTSASVHALSALGVKRIALLTPYPDNVNALVHDYLTSHGIEAAACATFRSRASAILGRTPPTRIPPEAVFDAAVALGRSEVDGVFVSCTGLRCLPVIAEIERQIGKPVVSSNQALAWHCLRLSNCETAVPGFGRLLET